MKRESISNERTRGSKNELTQTTNTLQNKQTNKKEKTKRVKQTTQVVNTQTMDKPKALN